MDRLEAIFSRQGFTDGYYRGRTGPAMFGVRQEGGEDRALLAQARATYESVENPLVPVEFYMIVNQDSAMLAVQDPLGNVCKAIGPRPEPAVRRALTVEELAARYGFRYGKVTVRATRSRWGSCSSRNDISLSIFLVRLPLPLIEYVIVHELCHTCHKDHSARFHALADTLLGGREKELAREIRRYVPDVV